MLRLDQLPANNWTNLSAVCHDTCTRTLVAHTNARCRCARAHTPSNSTHAYTQLHHWYVCSTVVRALVDYQIDVFIECLFADTAAARRTMLVHEVSALAHTHYHKGVLQSQFMATPLHMLYAKVAALTRTTMDACVPAKRWWRMKYGTQV